MFKRSKLGIKSKYIGAVSFERFDCDEVTAHKLAMAVLEKDPVLKKIFIDSQIPLEQVSL